MTNNDLISIITPFKNSSEFLNECLESIINQSYLNWELIIIDDYSNDNSFQLVNNISLKDKRIKLFKNEGKKGIINCLRQGLNKCSGDYITRMDSDDVMDKDKLKELHKSLKISGKGYVSTSKVKYFSKKGLGSGYEKYENWLNKMMVNNDNFNHNHTKSNTFPKSLINGINFFIGFGFGIRQYFIRLLSSFSHGFWQSIPLLWPRWIS